MTAIEDARAFLEPWGDDPDENVPRAVRVVRALVAEIDRLTAPPTDDEREALVAKALTALMLDPAVPTGVRPHLIEGEVLVIRERCDAEPIVDTILDELGFRRQGPITDEWEYRPGWVDADGRVFAQSGVIAPAYVDQFMAEGGEVIRRRVGKFEPVEAAGDAS